MESNQVVIQTQTKESEVLVREQSSIVAAANAMIVTNKAEYDTAAGALKNIKAYIKKAKDYWSPLKSAAKAAHTAICDKEKEMLAAPQEAESTISGKMAKWYRDEQSRIEALRREEERKRKEESDRLLAEAAAKEAEGNMFEADVSMFMAEAVSEAPKQVFQAPKVQGVAARSSWVAEIENPDLVPVKFNGVEIRKIDTSVLNQLARMYKDSGTTVPGVRFVEKTSIVGTGR